MQLDAFEYELDNHPKLGTEQEEALELIKKFLNSTSDSFSIVGAAGTGKTHLTKAIIKYLESKYIHYCLCAPTHKAALVIEQFTNRKAKTLHSLLAMSPKLDILKLNFRELQFNSGESKEIPNDGVVICDEASMVNDELFDFLVSRCKSFNTKIIFVADDCQIQPVKQESKSKVFKLKNIARLTKIYRQSKDSGLVDILVTLRNKPVYKFETTLGEEGNLYCYKEDLKGFLKKAVNIYKNAISTKNILDTKILTYTNKRVNSYNQFFHNNIFDNFNQYNRFEFLTCYCNMKRNYMEFWNSMDYIITEEPERIDFDIPKVGIVPGYKLTLYDSLTKDSTTINIIDKKYQNFMQLAAIIESLRLDAVYEDNTFKKKLAWKEYFKTVESFTTPIDLKFDNRVILKKSFDYGYACTIHRSQGSTINNVFIDMEDTFKQSNSEELRQLQYVALSRTKKDCHIYL